ncbi:immunoglobulin domain-containing protein [Escherichia coli]|nr:immunoglobulin domain-containing protein [Escherichia coli]
MTDMTNGAQTFTNQGKGANGKSLILTSEASLKQRSNLSRNLSYEISEYDTGGIIDFSTRDGDAGNTLGNPSQLVTGDYIEALVASLDATFNDNDYKAALQATGISCEWRPARTNPTPIQIQQLKTKRVHFDGSKGFIDAASAPKDSVGTGTLEAGQTIFLNPIKKACQFKATSNLFDFHIATTGFTVGSLQITLEQFIHDVTENLSSAIVEAVDSSASLKTIYPAALAAKSPADMADEILDAISWNVSETGFADHMDEVAVIMPKAWMTTLERLAQKGGYGAGAAAVSSMLGCTILSYAEDSATKTTGDVYILPKRLIAVSFRSALDGSGKSFKVVHTRDAKKQAHVIEVIGCLDVLGEAWTEVNADGSTVTSQIKHMVKLAFGAALSLSTDLPATKAATVGDDVTLSIKAAGGKAPLSYQWFYKGSTGDFVEIIKKPTEDTSWKTDTLTNGAVTVASSGSYKCVVTDADGSTVTSQVCVLTVTA